MNYLVKFYKQKQPIEANVEGILFGSVPMFWIETKNNTFWVNPRSVESIVLKSSKKSD